MTAYDREENDVDYWDAIYLLQEAEVLVESGDPKDVIEATEMLETYKRLRQNIKHIDMDILDYTARRIENKISIYFG